MSEAVVLFAESGVLAKRIVDPATGVKSVKLQTSGVSTLTREQVFRLARAMTDDLRKAPGPAG